MGMELNLQCMDAQVEKKNCKVMFKGCEMKRAHATTTLQMLMDADDSIVKSAVAFGKRIGDD